MLYLFFVTYKEYQDPDGYTRKICTLMIKSIMTRRDIGNYVKACKQKHVKQPIRVVDNLCDGSIYTAKKKKIKKKKKNS